MNGPLQMLETPAHAPATNTLSDALTHFDCTAVRLGLDSGTTQLLRAPLREYRVMVPSAWTTARQACSKESACSTTMRVVRSRAGSGFTHQPTLMMCGRSRC